MGTFAYDITLCNSYRPMVLLTKGQRLRNMIVNKSRGINFETAFGKFLWNTGIQYRKNDASAFSILNFVIKRLKI